MAGFNIAELIATFEAKGAQNTVQDIGRVQAGFDRTGASASKAGEQIDRTVSSMNRAGRAATGAAGGTSKLREAQLRAAAATERYNALLADERATLARVAAAEASVIAANRRLAASSPARSLEATGAAAEAQVGALGRAKSGVVGFMDSMAKLGLGLAGFEAVIKGIELVKSGSDFQKQMLQIQTMAGASTADVKTLSKAVLGMAGEVAASPEDLAKSLYHVEQNSHGLLSTAQMLNVLKVGAEGAKIGLADVEDTTNAMTIATASGIKGVQNMSSAMGTMLAIAGTGDMRLSDLTEAMGTGILSIAKQFGATLNDVAAVLATLGDNGIRGTDAAQGLRQVLMGMADPAKRGADSLAQVGLSMTDLRDDMEKHGLVHAMNDLDAHMKAAGVTGQKVGGFITDVFGRRAGKSIAVLFGEMDRVNAKAAEGLKGAQSFASRWEATTKTAAFGWERLGAAIQAGAIKAFEDAAPAIGRIGQLLADDVPKAAHVAEDALAPFIIAWHVLDEAVGPVESTLSGVGGVLRPLAPLVKGVTGATLSMWVAFTGYKIARAAIFAVQDAAIAMGAAVKNKAATQMQNAMMSNASVSATSGRIMQAEFAQIEASAMEAAAVQERAAARTSAAYADQVAASTAATDAQVRNAVDLAAAQNLAARNATVAAVRSATAAETASVAVVAAGETAEIGWASLAGPLALAAIGVMSVVMMFHKSAQASKEASDAAKAYTNALSGDGGNATIIDAITAQLADNDVAAKIGTLNKALGESAFTGKEFVDAIAHGGPALAGLREKLQIVAASSTMFNASLAGGTDADRKRMQTRFKTASALLDDLNKQYGALSDAQRKDLRDTKAFAGSASSIDKVALATSHASDTAKQYAEMMGITVDQNGVAAVSSGVLAGAVQKVGKAYNTATQSGDGFLAALKTFSGSAGTAADRAALIGATLVAANGDLLAYAGSLAGASEATHKLGQDIRQAASQIGASGISTQAYLTSLINLKTGTIDYRKAGAGPLIQDLQSMQSAAMNAAQATFQHEHATRSAKDAADAAYQVYKAQTSGALVDEARKLGLTAGQAQKLADKYFGMPKRVKTLIEQEGANPIVDVLNRIGEQLQILTGHPWKINTDAHTQAAQTKLGRLLTTMHQIGQGVNAQVLITTHNQTTGTTHTHKASAGGGTVTEGTTGTADDVLVRVSKGEEIINAKQAAKHRGLLKAINAGAAGFASGGTVGTISLGHAQHGTTVSSLLGSGDLGTELFGKLSMAGKQLVASVLSVAASLHRVQGSSISAVSHAIAASVAPDPSTPQGWEHRLAVAARLATADREQYEIAQQNVQALNKHAAALDSVTRAAQRNYSHLSSEATELTHEASAITGSTKADKARKASLEDKAHALRVAADAAKTAADADQKTSDAADKLASRAKSDFDKIKSASQSATQAMQQDAQQLVQTVQSQFDTLQQTIQTFESGIGSSLTGGSDLSTIAGQLQQNLDTATSALQSAQSSYDSAAQAVQDAQSTVLPGSTAQGATPDQLKALADAQNQLTAAQQAYTAAKAADSAGGVSSVLGQFATQEQQFASDLSKLQASGAGQDLINQLAGLGADAGDALAQGLINDPASLQAITKSMGVIQSIANDEGANLASGFYGAGIAAMTQLISGIETKYPALQKVLAPIAAQLASMFSGGGGSYTVRKGDTLASIMNAEYGVSKSHPQLASFLAANPELAGVGHTADLSKFAGTSLSIPQFAKGVTDFAGGLAYVHKDELLVNMPRGTDVLPANRAVPAGAFGGGPVTINVHMDGRRIASGVAPHLSREIKVLMGPLR